MSHTWDPDRYLRYADERGRPFVELLARVPAERPGTVLDLGCGPANLTRLLAERWPEARVAGLDSSAEMIARGRADHPGLDLGVGDLRDHLAAVATGTTTAEPVDVLVCNATLQWVPGHLDLMPALLAATAPGGWLAFQVPGNMAEPSHALRRELAAEPRYAAATDGVDEPASHDPADYLTALTALGCEVEAWETTYLHVLTGPDPVLTWISGTGARPTLAALAEYAGDLRRDFEAELGARLRAAYPPRSDGSVVLPFRRVFVVAQAPWVSR